MVRVFSALRAWSVYAVLLAVGLAVAAVARDRGDHESIEAAAARPLPHHPEMQGFRFPDPGDYPLRNRPWIKSREDFIASLTRGEDPAVVRRYSEGPEDELIEYLGVLFKQPGRVVSAGPPDPPAD